MSTPSADLVEAITKYTRLQQNDQFTDLTLSCGAKTVAVHSMLLSCRSTFFAAAVKNGFKEGRSRVVELPEDDVNLILKMLSYLYGASYQDSTFVIIGSRSCDRPYVSALNTHTGMYQLGDKFGIPGLKKHASERFAIALKAAEEKHCDVTDMMAAIPLIYATTPQSDRGLRDLAMAWVQKKKKELSELPAFREMIPNAPDFVLELIFKDVDTPKRFFAAGTCHRCKSIEKWKIDHVTCSCGWGERVCG